MAMKKGGKEQASLRDHQRALDAVCGELPPLVAIAGECEFLRAGAVAAYREAWLARYARGDVATLRAVGEARPAGLADVVAELSGASLFAKEKLVLVRQAERIFFSAAAQGREKPSGDREAAFTGLLENPPARIWLVVESSQLPKNRTMGKRLSEHCRLVPCPLPTGRDIPAWLAGRARAEGKRMDDAAVDLLTRAHGTDLGVLAAELEKLILFAGEDDAIDAGTVSEFLTGSVEFDIFGFTNAVEARDAEQAVRFARRIATQGTRDQRGKREGAESSAHKVMSMLAGTVRGLLRARVALARGADAGSFASEEGISPWRAGRLLEASARFSLRELRLMAAYAAEQMRSAHDTGGDPLLSLELMAVRFTSGNPGVFL